MTGDALETSGPRGDECNGDVTTVEPTGENDCMNKQVAYALIDAELRRLQERSYSDVSALIGQVETKERVGKTAKHINSKFKRSGTARKAQMSG